MSLLPGSQFGSYEIAALIGVGGMGEVYSAIDTNLKRAVALKVLPELVASDAERLARFQREAEVLASLNHPNIAIIHGLQKADGVTALVMELVEGVTLAERIARGPIPLAEANAIAVQIADALDSAHQRVIVHRDLKPANIKVRPDGTVKVLDFGLAKTSEAATGQASLSHSPTITSPAVTHPGVILGTVAYMAPEQARGLIVDRRADIWAFGAVLFEMLTGHPAFHGEDATETLAAILKLDPDWDGLPASLAPSLVWVLRRCLQKDPKQRLRDIADVRLLLEGSFGDGAFGAPSPLARSPGRMGVSRAALLLTAGIVAGLAVAAAVSLVVAERDNESVSISRFEVPFRPGQRGGDFVLSADGQTLIYRALGEDGQSRLYRRSMNSFASTPVEGSEDGSNPFFSPDGRWLGFVAGRTLKRVSVAGGPAETLAELAMTPRGASWDADAIVLGGGSAGLLRVPSTGGKPTVLASAAAGRQLWYPQVLPGARSVLFTQSRFREDAPGEDTPELQVLDLESGQRRSLLSGSAGRFVRTGHIVFLRDDALWAAAFDPDRVAVIGMPTPLVDGIGDRTSRFVVADEGSLAYLPGGTAESRRMVWVDRSGHEQTIAAPARGYTYPRLSPDGGRLAIDIRDQGIDIWIWDFARGTLTRLTFDPAQDEYPVWTRDGRQIFFASFRENAWGVFLQPADGRGAAQRVGTGPTEIDPSSLSPDGSTLVARANDNVVTLPAAGPGEPVALLSTRFVEGNAEISPDGRWIAYQSDDSGRPEIYVRPFPDVANGLWQISNDGGEQPLWARNGRELFYVAPGGLMSVRIQPGPSFMFGNAHVVLRGAQDTYWLSTVGRSYDVSPDGRHFLMLKEEAVGGATIRIVQHWHQELNRLVPTR